jgi:NAD(P)H-hydrate epimerase
MPPEVMSGLPALTRRPVDSHKGSFGHVLVVAGSTGMSGAAILCATAAVRGGAGLVTLAAPQPVVLPAATSNPCYLTLPLPADDDGHVTAAAERTLFLAIAKCSVLAVGCGLGQGPAVTRVVLDLLSRAPKPCVLDADGLNAVARSLEAMRRRDPLIITPHPGEFARMLGTTAAAVQADREHLAVEFAAKRGVILLLKGHQTIVTDGKRLYRNPTGNPGMATGGTGDVLTGLIAALLAQKLEPFAAAQLGAYLHGLAGDLARDALGETCLTATDVIAMLPRAFHSVIPR